MQFGFSFHPAFKKVFDTLDKAEDGALFYAINEENFLSEWGGHAQDDPLEFFASLVNTLNAPEWQKKVDEMDPRIRGLYYHSLLALREALKTQHPPIEEAQVFRQLNERISAVEAMGQHKPFEALALTPASELLKKGPNPVQVIDVWDFQKEVLDAKEPVVVFLFEEFHQGLESVLHSLVAKYKGRAKVVALQYRYAQIPHVNDSFERSVGMPRLYLFHDGKLVHRPDDRHRVRSDEEVGQNDERRQERETMLRELDTAINRVSHGN